MSTWEERAKEVQAMLDQGMTQAEIAKHFNVSKKTVKNRVWELRRLGLLKLCDELQEPEEKNGYKESVEIYQDGTHKSDKLLRMSSEQSKDVNFLLAAHGYDKAAWELVSARSNIWNAYSKQDGVMTLYASKITVKPRKASFSIDDLLAAIRETKPVSVNVYALDVKDKRMLEIPLFDCHFGVSDLDLYKPTQAKILDKLASRNWQESFFVVGSDLLHHDNFRNQTASGTVIEQVDMVKAWNDCRAFYEPMIDEAIKHSSSVLIMYSKGNHDESFSWGFVQFLKARYPQVVVDDSLTERKIHTFGKCFVGITHGDKAKKQLHNIFPIEFPVEWANATTREIHTGHHHVEDAKDNFGMMVRTLATRNRTDQWHKDNGYVGAHKRFQIFEYSEEQLESIHYV